METNLIKSLVVVTLISMSGASVAQAGWNHRGVPCDTPAAVEVTVRKTAPVNSGAIYKVVQQTAQYNLRRPEVVSGSRVTLFANFLRQEPGCVIFNLNGASIECTLVEWRGDSVTVELPKLGLREPKNAEIQVILPDGRIAKTFPVLYISQPDIVMHQETIPQPMPPAPTSGGAVYAMPVQGGFVLQAGVE